MRGIRNSISLHKFATSPKNRTGNVAKMRVSKLKCIAVSSSSVVINNIRYFFFLLLLRVKFLFFNE